MDIAFITLSTIKKIRTWVRGTSYLEYDFDGLLALINSQPYMKERGYVLTDDNLYDLTDEIPEIDNFIDHRGY
jgi:hypothetical protein